MDDAPKTSGDGYIGQTGFVTTSSRSGGNYGSIDNIGNYGDGKVILDHCHLFYQTTHNHAICSDGTTESRPINYAIKIWKRVTPNS